MHVLLLIYLRSAALFSPVEEEAKTTAKVARKMTHPTNQMFSPFMVQFHLKLIWLGSYNRFIEVASDVIGHCPYYMHVM